MAVFFAAYCRHNMNSPAYCLKPPPRIRLEADHQLRELSVFRMYLRAFLRPAATPLDAVLSHAANREALTASQTIIDLYERWIRAGRRRWGSSTAAAARQANRESLRHLPWHQLPAHARNPLDLGSPGWVRSQCVHLLHFVLEQAGHRAVLQEYLQPQGPCTRRDHFLTLRIPYVDAAFVASAPRQLTPRRAVGSVQSVPETASRVPEPVPHQQQQHGRRRRRPLDGEWIRREWRQRRWTLAVRDAG